METQRGKLTHTASHSEGMTKQGLLTEDLGCFLPSHPFQLWWLAENQVSFPEDKKKALKGELGGHQS